MPALLRYVLAVAFAFGTAALLTPLVRALARRWGFVARPKSDRWHTTPTALMGGVAIFLAVMTAELLFVRLTPEAFAVLGSSAFLFLIGLVDDLYNLKPYQKLAGQVLAAVPVVASGLVLPWTGIPPLNAAITLLWLVGITNALNLLDNMDGLAAGIAAIGCATLGFHSYATGQTELVVMLAIFGAALLGFLVYNTNPASIFMGDCGSLFIGFFLAGTALLSPSSGRSRSFLPVLAVPVLTLFVPIFDTTLVMILRKLVGRPVSQGGRDHTSHRLVALGLSERTAVLMLYGLAALSGGLAILVHDLDIDVSLAVIVGFTIVLTIVGYHLARVRVYDQDEMNLVRDRPLVSFIVNLSYKRRLFEILLDVLLIGLAYHTAFVIVNGSIASTGAWERLLPVIALLIAVKLPILMALGVYRGLWRYVSLDDLVTYSKAVVTASVASMLTLIVFHGMSGLSRAVVILDGLLLLVFLAGSRLSFRLFRLMIPAPTRGDGRRVLIFGAGDAGVLLAREFLNNPSLGRIPIGFADDDPHKQGSVIHGLRVYDGMSSLTAVCLNHRVEEIVISTTTIPEPRLRKLISECQSAAVPLHRLRIQIEQLEDLLLPEVRDSQPVMASV